MRPIAATPSKYLAISAELQRRILSGDLPPGSRFPTLDEIMEEFGVAQQTAHQAVKRLRDQGLIRSKVGAQSRVREPAALVRTVRSPAAARGAGSPWRADMATQGHTGSWRASSEPIPAPPAIAERLHIAPGDDVMRTAYVFTADSEPAYLSTSYEPMALTGGTPILLPEAGPFAGHGVRDRFGAIGMRLTHETQYPSGYLLTIAEAELLGEHPDLICVLYRRTWWCGETPVETADIVVPPGVQVEFVMDAAD